MDERDMDYWFGSGGKRHAWVDHQGGTRPERRPGWVYESVELGGGALTVHGTMNGKGK